ncbi:hypothetical protein N7493_011099 [Penicillium malachiteum]|uniref:NACHT domain-containing protein n=1 Tax=Penicillium malachiteum TaxID=1324776 RepID=A0AAD6HBI2_9EURO|nr:hypothetical protein N7493_011099 [Penicillium malachiteum]
MAVQLQRKGKERKEGQNVTECLDRALNGFSKVLTAEEKEDFEKNTANPDAGSVIIFVAELDAEKASKTRRSVSPRLFKFLDAAQQFSGAVETFVSSNPQTAALIWGGIKTAILVASNIASYFDKVTNMIQEIGRACPVFQDFGKLYHGHVGLQHALCEYYALVVELCGKVVEVSRRSLAIQTISSIWNPFESEFQSFLDRLVIARSNIDLEISHASNQAAQESRDLIEYDTQQNSLFRPSVIEHIKRSMHGQNEIKRWQMNQIKREEAVLKINIRQNLSPVDHIYPWRQNLKQRVPSTAEWLIDDPEFRDWKNSDFSAILWCSGTLGMGKTVLMSNVVSHLHTCCPNDTIAHFFCQAENEPSLLARNVFGSLARQLLNELIEESSYEQLLSLQNQFRGLDTNETLHFLLSRLTMDQGYYIVLDGLDECETAQIREIARALHSIHQLEGIKLRVVCASRPDLEGDLFEGIRPHYRIVIDKQKVNSDMDRYITTTLKDCLDRELLAPCSDKMMAKIVDVLRNGAQGMFLWAGLCIKELCEANCDEDLLETLHHLPRSLAELFNSKSDSQAMTLLQYCGVVKRPLNLEEYRELLGISLEDKSLNTKKLPKNMNRVVKGCFGLLYTDDDEETIHYIHQSVREYLFHREPALFDDEGISQHVGVLCMTYLNFSNFNGQLAKLEKRIVDPLFIGTSSIYPGGSLVHEMTKKVLSLRKERAPGIKLGELEKIALEPLGDFKSDRPNSAVARQTNAFLLYAKENWLFHLQELQLDGSQIWSLFCKCIEDRSLPLIRAWEPEFQNTPGSDDISAKNAHLIDFAKEICVFFGHNQIELTWMLANNHYALFLYFMNRSGDHHWPFTLVRSFPHLSDGSSYRWVEILIDGAPFIFSWGMALVGVVFDEGLTETERFEASLRILQKMSIIDSDKARFTLGMALRRTFSRDGTLELLLSVDKELYPINRVVNGKLHVGQANSILDRVKMEESDPLLIDRLQMEKRDPLLIFSLSQDPSGSPDKTRMIHEILDSGADVNVADDEGKRPIHFAAEAGHLEIVKDLLSHGAQINLQDKHGNTALHAAAAAHGIQWHMMEYLVSAGATTVLENSAGKTAMDTAVSQFISQLLYLRTWWNPWDLSQTSERAMASFEDFIPELNAQIMRRELDFDHTLGTHLADLAQKAMWPAVELLVKIGVNTNMRGHAFNKIALHWAGEQNNGSIVKLLLERGSDPNTLDYFGQTSLHYAAEKGFEEVTACLLEVTDASIVDRKGRTALRCARDNGHYSTVEMLISFAGPTDYATDEMGRTLQEWLSRFE